MKADHDLPVRADLDARERHPVRTGHRLDGDERADSPFACHRGTDGIDQVVASSPGQPDAFVFRAGSGRDCRVVGRGAHLRGVIQEVQELKTLPAVSTEQQADGVAWSENSLLVYSARLDGVRV